jgi:hypothetical protein
VFRVSLALGKLPAEEATMTTEIIDCTPNWEATAHMLLAILQSNPSSVEAREELLRMGKIIDQQMVRISELREAHSV